MYLGSSGRPLALIAVALLVMTGAVAKNVESRVDAKWAATLQRVQLGVMMLTTRVSNKPGHPPDQGAGSAFAVSGAGGDYYIVTVAHVVPVATDRSTIEGAVWPAFLPKRGPVVLKLVAVDRSQLVDLAVLIPAKPEPLAYRTLSTRIAPPVLGLPVAILGYPDGGRAEFVEARISGQGPDGTLKLSGIVEEGFSGAPVFDSDGNVICIVKGGQPVADIPRNKKVMGKALCTPVAELLKRWTFAPLGERRPTASPPQMLAARELTFNVTPDVERLMLARSIDVTKDDHPVVLAPNTSRYSEAVSAPEGYKIVGAEFTEWSANGAKWKIERSQSNAVLSFSLTSGPQVDRYRGWLKGKFVVTIVKQQ